jgi:hypothetical protein
MENYQGFCCVYLDVAIGNVRIPVMLAIDPKEDKDFCETFFTILYDHFYINLNGYRAVSDQEQPCPPFV